MKVEQRIWQPIEGWKTITNSLKGDDVQLVLAFGGRDVLEDKNRFDEIRNIYPAADILLSSTSGEIFDTRVIDDALVVTGVAFEHTKIKAACVNIDDFPDCRQAGAALSDQLKAKDLCFVFIISDGIKANGSELAIGLHSNIDPSIPVTGGLAGDGDRFQKTLVGINEAPGEDRIVALGFYGSRLGVGHGSFGGWDPFGPERVITRSEGNILFELDTESALELYKKYLGKHAEELPGSALLFPLSIQIEGSEQPIVRTILGIDENKQSMIFAGDMPEGARARLMYANFDRLIEGASTAANLTLQSVRSPESNLAICISCVGRKLVLKHRIEEEVEDVRNVLGETPVIAGFYSYGEISPFSTSARCELHNQTMTITTLTEN